jgi:hypothetical protein
MSAPSEGWDEYENPESEGPNLPYVNINKNNYDVLKKQIKEIKLSANFDKIKSQLQLRNHFQVGKPQIVIESVEPMAEMGHNVEDGNLLRPKSPDIERKSIVDIKRSKKKDYQEGVSL